MKRAADRQHLRLITEVSVSPLLNLVLILLIVFLIAAPLLRRDPALVLPEVPSTTSTLAIANAGQLKLNDSLVTQENLLDAVKKVVENDPETGIIVRMQPDAPVSHLVAVMAVLKSAGVRKTAVQTDPPGETEP